MPSPSAAVYRRRRLAVFGGLVLVLAAVAVGIWLLIAQPWAPSDAADRTPSPKSQASQTPTESPSDEPTASSTPDPTPTVAACTASDVRVEAVTDAESYQADVQPKLSIRLTNTSDADCTLNVGSSTQTFTITSGSDTWWRSTDCQQNPSDMIVTLKAGEDATSVEPVIWDRTRSSVDTCGDENRPRAPGGGASYYVGVSIGGFDSETPTQILLY